MRMVLQRVTQARVDIAGETVGAIGNGLLVLLGISDGDTEALLDRYAQKLVKLRIFEDEQGKTNRSVQNVGGSLLVVSQFTLYADCSHGNRPGFTGAGAPAHAERMYDYFVGALRRLGQTVQTGRFGADMQVTLTNDGPFTVLLEEEA